eukprot:gene15264-13630_t
MQTDRQQEKRGVLGAGLEAANSAFVELWPEWRGGAGDCMACQNGQALLAGQGCVSTTACESVGGAVQGLQSTFFRKCVVRGQTAPSTTRTPHPYFKTTTTTKPTATTTTTTLPITTTPTTTSATTTPQSTVCVGKATNTGSPCTCERNCHTCPFHRDWPVGGGGCSVCKNGYTLLPVDITPPSVSRGRAILTSVPDVGPGVCIASTECEAAGCSIQGRGKFNRQCVCTTPTTTETTTTSATTTPTTTTTPTHTDESSVCVGKRTNTGASCKCADNCHTCDFEWGLITFDAHGPAPRGAGRCSTCKNGRTLFADSGICVPPEQCEDAGCSVKGRGKFNRVCVCTTPTTTPSTTATTSTTPTTTSGTTTPSTTPTTVTTPTTTPTTTVFSPGFTCSTGPAPFLLQVAGSGPHSCASHARVLSGILKTCAVMHARGSTTASASAAVTALLAITGGKDLVQCSARFGEDGAETLFAPAGCTDVAAVLAYALQSFGGPAAPEVPLGCAFGGHLFHPTECDATTSAMSGMVTAHAAGDFRNCDVTTPTTTVTTTATSTPFSRPVLSCVEKYDAMFLGSRNCGKDVGVLARLLDQCGHAAAGASLDCVTEDSTVLLSQRAGRTAADCAATADAINDVLRKASAPSSTGGDAAAAPALPPTVACAFGVYFTVAAAGPSECERASDLLNDGIYDYITGGSFAECTFASDGEGAGAIVSFLARVLQLLPVDSGIVRVAIAGGQDADGTSAIHFAAGQQQADAHFLQAFTDAALTAAGGSGSDGSLPSSVLTLLSGVGASSGRRSRLARRQAVPAAGAVLACVGRKIAVDGVTPVGSRSCACGPDCFACDHHPVTGVPVAVSSSVGSCSKCKNAQHLLDGRCVKTSVCINTGGIPTGAGKFGRVCMPPGAAPSSNGNADDDSPGSDADGTDEESGAAGPVATALVSGVCTGKSFSAGDETGACGCLVNCHTCQHVYRVGPGPSLPSACMKCKNDRYLAANGDCIDAASCISASGIPTGNGKFGRRCATGDAPPAASTATKRPPATNPPRTPSSSAAARPPTRAPTLQPTMSRTTSTADPYPGAPGLCRDGSTDTGRPCLCGTSCTVCEYPSAAQRKLFSSSGSGDAHTPWCLECNAASNTVELYGQCVPNVDCTLAAGTPNEVTAKCDKESVVLVATTKPLSETHFAAISTLKQRGMRVDVILAGSAARDPASQRVATDVVDDSNAVRKAAYFTLAFFGDDVPNEFQTTETS